jgi:hypothetical protein
MVIAGNEIIYEDEWLSFQLSERKPKTNVYDVVSKCSLCILGVIKWYPQWRHYCFFPNTLIKTVYSDRCLLSISEFITKLSLEKKEDKMENILKETCKKFPIGKSMKFRESA